MEIPPHSKKQDDIIFYLYQFRYLLIKQLIKLFEHKDKKRLQIALNDLVSKKFITYIEDKEIADGYIYCLDTKARYILKEESSKEDSNIDEDFLDRLYKEKTKEVPFIKRNLFIADIFLFFLSRKTKGQVLNFFTKQELGSCEYFPDPLPTAYIEEIDGADTNNAPFPTILVVLPSDKRKYHIKMFSQAILTKNIGDDIDLFLTTKREIRTGQVNWEEISPEE